MSGIYVHIPFCKKACHYCNFHFSTLDNYKDEMVAALKKEIGLRKDETQAPIETIYFGGGTPSTLSATQINLLIVEVFAQFNVVASPEITIEANPDDLTLAYLKAIKEIGINRLSIGIQSFQDKELNMMNRVHNGKQAVQAVIRAKEFFDNISIDLLFGIPDSNFTDWKENLEIALKLDVPHISCLLYTSDAADE